MAQGESGEDQAQQAKAHGELAPPVVKGREQHHKSKRIGGHQGMDHRCQRDPQHCAQVTAVERGRYGEQGQRRRKRTRCKVGIHDGQSRACYRKRVE